MFKIKDLMIKIIPEEGKMAEGQLAGCGDCTNCTVKCTACTDTPGCRGGCSDWFTCKGGSQVTAAGCGLTCAPNTCRVCTFVCTDECSACSQQVLTCKCTDSPTCRVGTCGYGSCNRTYGVEAGQPLTLENLAVLKAQLRQQLAAIEEQEKLAHESLKPATLEEAEALEKKLVEALDEIKAITADLKKKKKKA